MAAEERTEAARSPSFEESEWPPDASTQPRRKFASCWRGSGGRPRPPCSPQLVDYLLRCVPTLAHFASFLLPMTNTPLGPVSGGQISSGCRSHACREGSVTHPDFNEAAWIERLWPPPWNKWRQRRDRLTPRLHLLYPDRDQSASIGQPSIVDIAPLRHGRNTIRQPRSSSRSRDCGSRRTPPKR